MILFTQPQNVVMMYLRGRLDGSHVGKLLLANRGFHTGGQTSTASQRTSLQDNTTRYKSFTNASHFCVFSNQFPHSRPVCEGETVQHH